MLVVVARPRIGRLLIALILCLPASRVGAQPWTVERAIDAAIAASSDVRAASGSVFDARQAADRAPNAFLPGLDLTASASRPIFAGADDEPFSLAMGAGLSLTVPTAYRARAERLQVSLAEASVAEGATVAAVTALVRRRFFAVLLARDRLAIAVRNAALAERRRDQIQLLFEQGRAAQLELVDAEAAAIARLPEVNARRGELAESRIALEVALGLEPRAEIELAGEISVDLPALGEESVVSAAVAGAPRLAARRAAISRAAATLTVDRRAALAPRVTARVAWSPAIGAPTDLREWRSADTWRTGNASITVAVPLDPWVSVSADRTRLESDARAVSRDLAALADLEREIEGEALALVRSIGTARDTLAALDAARAVAQRRYDATRAAFDSGGVDLLAVENAQADLERADLDLVLERFALVSAAIALDELSGGIILGE